MAAKIPFDAEGNLCENGSYGASIFKTPEEASFRDRLIVTNISFYDGGAKRVYFVRESNGQKVSMSITDFQRIIDKYGLWEKRLPSLNYTFERRGSRWFCVPTEDPQCDGVVDLLTENQIAELLVEYDRRKYEGQE